MKIFIKTLVVATAICIALACSKTETPVKPAPIKCTNSTILDALLSGKQMYLLTTVGSNKVLLNLKDKKGKARVFGRAIVNPDVYEWDLQISSVSETEVKLQAGDIIAIRGIFVTGVYFPDSFFFKDDNCKITGETSDGQTVYNNPILYEDVTNSKDLPDLLEKYLW